MKTSKQWYDYFKANLEVKRINWNQPALLTKEELTTILPSLQAWQLGETSDGSNLLKAGKLYAQKTDDPFYVKALELFIKEEQKHGHNLGLFLDAIQQSRIQKNWGDSLFRKVRHLNTSMQWWTIAVITVESAAQIYYQSLKDATNCTLLKEICTDILIDEAPHIQFQQERLLNIFQGKNSTERLLAYYWYKFFYFSTSLVVWMAHKKLFVAGNNNFSKYHNKMALKFHKTIGKLKYEIKKEQLIQSYQPL